MESGRSGPLEGIRILEFAGVGPGPFCAMLLADMGAEVVTIDRVVPHGLGIKREPKHNPITRSRRSIAVDLKHPAGRETVLKLVAAADATIEGNRPGVMERLGLGPDECLAVNPRLVYGRMTGWGQDGPKAMEVGHDLNYLAMSGLLSMIGPKGGAPTVPLNLLGDFAGGGAYLAIGILSALLEARVSGRGQIVDAAMIDGIGSLMTAQFGFLASDRWLSQRGSNFLDGGAPWYATYETSDGKYVSVAAVERKFFDELLRAMDIDPADVTDHMDRSCWPALSERFAGIFRSKSRDAWCLVMEGREACFAPVLDITEAQHEPHALARGGFVDVDGVVQPAPAPRFSRTPSRVRRPPPRPGEHTREVLDAWGFSAEAIDDLRANNAIA